MELTQEQKFEALKYRHEDQAKLSQSLASSDIKVFSSYLTLQLALGGFLVTNPVENLLMKIGLMIIDIIISLVAFGIIYRSFRRRKEIIKTIKNCNFALGFDTYSMYIKNKKINHPTTDRPWDTFFYIGIFAAVLGIALIILAKDILK